MMHFHTFHAAYPNSNVILTHWMFQCAVTNVTWKKLYVPGQARQAYSCPCVSIKLFSLSQMIATHGRIIVEGWNACVGVLHIVSVCVCLFSADVSRIHYTTYNLCLLCCVRIELKSAYKINTKECAHTYTHRYVRLYWDPLRISRSEKWRKKKRREERESEREFHICTFWYCFYIYSA